jgi:hypothetical protein
VNYKPLLKQPLSPVQIPLSFFSLLKPHYIQPVLLTTPVHDQSLWKTNQVKEKKHERK